MLTIPKPGNPFAATLVLLLLAGCNDPTAVVDKLPRKALSGTVTLDGQPLAQGIIQFTPLPGNSSPTTTAVGEIKAGKFAIDRALGPVPGNYKVSISSVPPVVIGAGQEPGERPKQDPEKVPARFNIQSTLTKEITSGEMTPLEFDLKRS